MPDPIRSEADAIGIKMFRQAHTPYTIPAFEATEFAKKSGLEIPFHQAIYEHYWTKSNNIEDIEVLKQIGKDVGLDSELLHQALSEGTYTQTIVEQYNEAKSYGISGIPAITIGKYLFTGARPYEFFQMAIEKVLEEDEEFTKDN
jgi:predicted DsbA family dithiol-disulfide isomerase